MPYVCGILLSLSGFITRTVSQNTTQELSWTKTIQAMDYTFPWDPARRSLFGRIKLRVDYLYIFRLFLERLSSSVISVQRIVCNEDVICANSNSIEDFQSGWLHAPNLFRALYLESGLYRPTPYKADDFEKIQMRQ